MSKSNRNILLIMTGSISCYKVCEVISQLTKQGNKVKVAATHSALKFVGVASLEGLSGEPVFTDEYEEGRAMDHIHLMKWADLVLVAPASANSINAMAAGLSSNIASSLFLSFDFKKDFYLAPAMNTKMFEHPITQKSLASLKEMGIKIIPPESGSLACGEIGLGRLAEPSQILEIISESF